MLDTLQQQLNQIYQLRSAYDVRDFLITDAGLAQALGGEAMLKGTTETLLMQEHGSGLSLSLFLDRELLERVESANPLTELHAHQLDDLWKVMEGLSHFVCMVWKASEDRSVSLLELELQAEIDKFVATMQLVLDQGDEDMLNRLHGWLFDDIRYCDALNDEQLSRYRDANEYAARYCAGLRRRFLENDGGALSELRRFYRLQLGDKISHIHAQAWHA